MSSSEVLNIIHSLDTGFNGEVERKQIGVEILSDTEAIYSLTVWEDDQPTEEVERYRLTLEPIEAEEPSVPTEPVAVVEEPAVE